MNKSQFLTELNESLKGLPTEEKQDILRDFEEHFEVGLNEGKSEREICESLGSPRQIGKELLLTHQLDKVENQATSGNYFGAAGNVAGAIWAAMGMGFFNLVFLLGPFVALVGIILSIWIVGITFAASPLLVVLFAVMDPEAFLIADLFRSIALAGIGLLLIIGISHITRVFATWFVRYLRYNVKLVRGGLKDD